nr:reverse transcriptase domain-containing protein [Tanacetum cinerariifolium]
MSTNEKTPLSQPTSAVRNTLRREQAQQNLVRHVSDEDMREYYDKNYHQILPIKAEKLHQEKAQQEKLKAVKACLNFKEASQYSESETSNKRRNHKERSGHKYARTRSGSLEPRRGRSKSPREKETKIASEKHRHKKEYSRRTKAVLESEGSAGGHWTSKPKKQKSSVDEDLSQPWAEMGEHYVHRIYVDGGSSSEILYEYCFSKFRPEIKNQLIPANTPLVRFSGEIIWPLGQIPLLVKIGRPRVRKIRAIPSTAYGMIKFPVTGGIVTLQSTKIISLECLMVSKPGVPREGTFLGYKVDADGLRVSPDKVKAVLDLPCTKKSDFQWSSEAEGAFKEMKQSIAEHPILMAPKEKEELIMYLAAAKEAINAYQPRTLVKGQILANFIVERPEDDAPDTPIKDREELPDLWILFTDRSSCIEGFGADLIIMNPERMEFTML